jgi:hypothetical protein
MMDLTPAKVFKSAAFEPSEEELSTRVPTKRKGKVITRKLIYSDDEEEEEEKEEEEKEEEKEKGRKSNEHRTLKDLSDSEDELPDVSHFLKKPATRGKVTAKVSIYLPYSRCERP